MKLSNLVFPILAFLPTGMARADGAGSLTGHMWGGSYGFMGGLVMLLFWGAVIALVVFLVFKLRDVNRPSSKMDAMEALKLQFVNGEIDEEEYWRLKAALVKIRSLQEKQGE